MKHGTKRAPGWISLLLAPVLLVAAAIGTAHMGSAAFGPAAGKDAREYTVKETGAQDLAAGVRTHAKSAVEGLRINEVVSDNGTSFIDAAGDTPDWIELHNPGTAAVELAGYGLSDDTRNPMKWVFPVCTIEPGGYLLVLAKGKPAQGTHEGDAAADEPMAGDAAGDAAGDPAGDAAGDAAGDPVGDAAGDAAMRGVGGGSSAGGSTAGSPLLADFAVSRHGESLVLSDPQGHTLQVLRLEAAPKDVAYGADADGTYAWWRSPTPGAENRGPTIASLKQYRAGCTITPSREGGCHPEPFELTLEADAPDLTIRYTLDGTPPDADSPRYEAPIPITDRSGERYRYADRQVTFAPPYAPAQSAVEQATVVTAQAFDGETPIGNPLIRTYLVDPDGAARYTLPIVSLTTDPDHLFDDETGIFAVGSRFRAAVSGFPDGKTPANYNQRGRAWERPVHLEYIENGVRVFSQHLGMRTFGAWSRSEMKKSLKLFARDAYEPDRSSMDYPFFPGLTDAGGQPVQSFRQLVLRNGGNDWNTTLFRDPLMQGLADDVAARQASKPVVVLLDGEYWGIYFLTESLDADWVAAHEAVPAESVGIIANDGELYEGTDADVADYNAFMDYVQTHDLSDPAAYAVVAGQVDVEAYLRYQAAQIYFGNLDWPGNNLKMYRVRPEAEKETETNLDAEADANTGTKTDAETDPPLSALDPARPLAASDGRWRQMLYDTDFGFGLYADISDVMHDTLWLTLDPVGKDWPNPPWSTCLFRGLMQNDACRSRFVAIMEESLQTRFSTECVQSEIRYWQKQLEPEMAEYAKRYPLWRIPDVATWKSEGIAHLKAYARLRPHQIRLQLTRHLGASAP